MNNPRLLPSLLCVLALTAAVRADSSLEFFGYVGDGVDRVKVPLAESAAGGGLQATPVNVGGDFTIEFWLKTNPEPNSGIVYDVASGDGWITGNILLDRDIFGSGDFGDFGIAIGRPNGENDRRTVSFGLFSGEDGFGRTVVGDQDIATGLWHHVAVVRDAGNDGRMALYVDGQLDAQVDSLITGNVGYDPSRSTMYPDSDPYLVIGTEKHDFDPEEYPSYAGLLDELRISDAVRYTSSFTPPAEPFASDGQTVLLLHFDEGGPNSPAGDYPIVDSTGLNEVTRYLGGSPAGPLYSSDTPFAAAGIDGDYNNDGVIDAADYTVWRDAMEGGGSLLNDPTPLSVGDDDYEYWRANFGMSPGSGAAAPSALPLPPSAFDSAVPEPTALTLCYLASLILFTARRRLD